MKPNLKPRKKDFAQARFETVTFDFLKARNDWAQGRGYQKAKWISFCQILLRAGLSIELYEARETVSKYLHITDGTKRYKVRYSNHMPNKGRELEGDCDFFVGRTHTGIRNSNDALNAVAKRFNMTFSERVP